MGTPRRITSGGFARGLALALALGACQGKAPAPVLPKGDEIMPGDVEPVGLAYCDVARLELVAIVLNGPPKGASLEDVRDATAPGCTWVAWDSTSRVRLNVYDETMFPALRVAGPAAQYNALSAAHARVGAGAALTELSPRATRFGFVESNPRRGVIIVEMPTRVLEFDGENVSPDKLFIFARGVTDALEKSPEG